ncbi:hypothetical protein FA10DRAFT_300243 [Acaromyces ingoldii]|uniref:Uncharacterized protein n=1 Tax=Acaromyces ingoldii TaxID=215250 RepID=A0A316YQ38_9BASI|nr:hypothetical protein FA10DRAFT_300243 [Acaromyces ingoldii]PWN91650.1 hypothetical protein FA10DRAFT_300243 [Acaromyces ingoldii]
MSSKARRKLSIRAVRCIDIDDTASPPVFLFSVTPSTAKGGPSRTPDHSIGTKGKASKSELEVYQVHRTSKELLALSARLIKTFDALLDQSRGGPRPLTGDIELNRFRSLRILNMHDLRRLRKRSSDQDDTGDCSRISQQKQARMSLIDDFFAKALEAGGEIVASSRAMQDAFAPFEPPLSLECTARAMEEKDDRDSTTPTSSRFPHSSSTSIASLFSSPKIARHPSSDTSALQSSPGHSAERFATPEPSLSQRPRNDAYHPPLNSNDRIDTQHEDEAILSDQRRKQATTNSPNLLRPKAIYDHQPSSRGPSPSPSKVPCDDDAVQWLTVLTAGGRPSPGESSSREDRLNAWHSAAANSGATKYSLSADASRETFPSPKGSPPYSYLPTRLGKASLKEFASPSRQADVESLREEQSHDTASSSRRFPWLHRKGSPSSLRIEPTIKLVETDVIASSTGKLPKTGRRLFQTVDRLHKQQQKPMFTHSKTLAVSYSSPNLRLRAIQDGNIDSSSDMMAYKPSQLELLIFGREKYGMRAESMLSSSTISWEEELEEARVTIALPKRVATVDDLPQRKGRVDEAEAMMMDVPLRLWRSGSNGRATYGNLQMRRQNSNSSLMQGKGKKKAGLLYLNLGTDAGELAEKSEMALFPASPTSISSVGPYGSRSRHATSPAWASGDSRLGEVRRFSIEELNLTSHSVKSVNTPSMDSSLFDPVRTTTGGKPSPILGPSSNSPWPQSPTTTGTSIALCSPMSATTKSATTPAAASASPGDKVQTLVTPAVVASQGDTSSPASTLGKGAYAPPTWKGSGPARKDGYFVIDSGVIATKPLVITKKSPRP